MNSSTPLNPKKLKDQLTSLRESIAFLESSHQNTPSPPWASFAGVALLLTTELASRGVHCALPQVADFSPNHLVLLLDTIHNTAGKPSIDEDTAYPPQLIAALHAASGMAAAACATIVTNTSNSTGIDDSVKQAFERSTKRCLDVSDGRFYVLLMFLSREDQCDSRDRIMNDIAYSNYLDGASKFAVDQVPMWKRCLDCALSGGSGDGKENYRSYMNSQTILPLQNMMRIAQSKQNVKRVEELRVWLVCGYIGAIRERLGCNNDDETKEKSRDISKQSIEDLVNNFFFRRCDALVELESLEVRKLLDLAKETLDACSLPDTGADYESRLLYQYLEVQIQYLSEESKIWLEVQRQIRAMKNRLPEKEIKSGGLSTAKGGISSKDDKGAPSVSSTTMNTADREKMEQETRRNVLLDAWSEWWDSPNRDVNNLSILGLRDVFIVSSSSTTLSSSSDLLEDCRGALEHQVQRLLDMAISLQQRRNCAKEGKNVPPDTVLACWVALVSFVSPLMMDFFPTITQQHAEDEEKSIKDSLRRLLECTSQAIVCAAWMCEPLMKTCSFDNGNVATEQLEFRKVSQLLSIAHRCLSLCRNERSTKDRQTPETTTKTGSVFSSSDKNAEAEKAERLLLDCALVSTKIRADLVNVLSLNENEDEDTNELAVQSLTAVAHKAAISAISSKVGGEPKLDSLTPKSAQAKFGATYLQFMSAWSGSYLSPWPFCNLGQGRSIIRNARESLLDAGKLWGREAGVNVENIVIDIAEADLEGGTAGGFVRNAKTLYERTLKDISAPDVHLCISSNGIALLNAHCCIGLARIFLTNETAESAQYARDALEALRKMEVQEGNFGNRSLICLYAWHDISLYNLARSYHECAARQLVAEALIRSSRPEEARCHLFEAVKADPSNFDATFALAAFELRSIIFNIDGNRNGSTVKNEAKNLLLKSAKIGKNKASPFALLGLFYELQGDVPRAIGCHKKALAIDPSHPVSGRGLLRLVSIEEVKPFCEAATKQNSPVIGWAWRLLGQIRSWKDGDYSSAVICFQLALRCRDVQDPEKDILGAFYTDPKKPIVDADVGSLVPTGNCEAGETWSELASCYRQLGKWSGSYRAYDAAYTVSKGSLSPDSLVAWAQVELELGLYNEAVKRCDEALLSSRNVPQLQRLAHFVKGKAILAVARQNIQEGKYGSCLSHIKMGLELEGRSSCELKLLGDLYSLSEALPPYVFVEDSTFSSYEGFDNAISPEIRRKLSLLARGVTSYEKALELAKTEDFDEDQKSIPDSHMTASAAMDLGSILLAQARVIALALGDGSGEGTHTTMSDLVGRHDQLRQIMKKSTNAFLYAIDANPNEAHAWCGIGCSLAAIDPLKAQHSFARALQLDKSCVEAWSNTGVLFSDHELREKGSEILDALTQAGDTPFMWICRGFLFEKSSDAWQEQASSREASLAKAADAYRAALQLCQHPSALLGLSLTCRRNDSDLLPDAFYSMLATEASKAEGMLSVSIHQNISGDCNLLAGHVNNFMKMERCLDRITYGFGEAIKDTLNRAKADAESLKAHLNSTTITDVTPESRFETTQFDIDCDSRLPLKAKRTGKLPTEAIDEVIAKVNSVSSIQTNACDVSQTHHNVDVNNARNRVYLNPDSGEEWLLFAKALAKEVCTTEYGSNDDRPEDFSLALASAKAAASRAHNILLESVVHASMISPTRSLNTHGTSVERSEMRVVSRVAPASIVSEAMSLVSWLNNLECLQRGEESANLCNTVSMQEAYLLDPINSLASNALGLASC